MSKNYNFNQHDCSRLQIYDCSRLQIFCNGKKTIMRIADSVDKRWHKLENIKYYGAICTGELIIFIQILRNRNPY